MYLYANLCIYKEVRYKKKQYAYLLKTPYSSNIMYAELFNSITVNTKVFYNI